MLKLTWGCDNFLLPAPQKDVTKPGFSKTMVPVVAKFQSTNQEEWFIAPKLKN